MQTEVAHDVPAQPPARKGVGLEELILSLLELVHDLLEKQVIRRMEAGDFSDDELEKLGHAMFSQDQQIDFLCRQFSIQRDTLDLLKILDTKGQFDGTK